MAAGDPLHKLTASEILAKTRAGELTVEEYARALLARIQERDGVVKAWAYLNPDLVIAQAKALDQVPLEQRGPLHGVAIGVKDVIYTKGECSIACPTKTSKVLKGTYLG